MIKRVSFSGILKSTAPTADEILDRKLKGRRKPSKANAQEQKYSLIPRWRRKPKVLIAKENMPKPK